MAVADSAKTEVDAVVIGAGFSGLFAVWRLTQSGLTVRAFDANDEIGGVWAWNRYPGAQTDSPHHTYRFTFDPQLLAGWKYSKKFPPGNEVLAYLNHVADEFDLRDLYTLSTRIEDLIWDEDSRRWTVVTDAGETLSARYVVTGLGLVSEPIVPAYAGSDSFRGDVLYTSSWPREGVDLKGKRIALIGTGSSGCQITPQLAAVASQLTVYVRTPNYVAPTGNHSITDEDQKVLSPENYVDVARRIRNHPAGFPFEASQGRLALEATEDEREAVFQAMWDKGGFSPLYESFDDVAVDPDANEFLASFFRRKIAEIVSDPDARRVLTPTYPYGAKRPPTGDGFYQAFNEDHVSAVSLRETPITQITESGIVTDGVEREFDVIVFATGFDASTGSFTRMNVVGRDGLTLREHWEDGPRTYLGIAVHDFPNFFMIAGPQSPFSNLPPGAEFIGSWLGDLLDHMVSNGIDVAEATAEAEDRWVALCEEIGAGSFSLQAAKEVNSWFTGANIEGKPKRFNIYFGGAKDYGDKLEAEAESGYSSFEKLSSPVVVS